MCIYMYVGFPGGTVVKSLPVSAGNTRLECDPWVGEIPLEKEMANHSGTLAWKIPWMEEPGRLQANHSTFWASTPSPVK